MLSCIYSSSESQRQHGVPERPGSAGSDPGVLEGCASAVAENGTARASCSSVPELSLQPCLSFPGLCV